MQTVTGARRPVGGTVVTVGAFDGVHRGHRALIIAAQELGNRLGLEHVVLTFDPHPRAVLRPDASQAVLTPTPSKLRLFEEYGVAWVKVLTFTPELARLSAFTFLEQELAAGLNAQGVVVGYNFTFGAGATGNAETIRAWASHRRAHVQVVDPIHLAGDPGVAISSSYIRGHVAKGDIGPALQALGHPLWVEGQVVKGFGRGRQIGVPTANLRLPPEQMMPPFGVYAGWAQVDRDQAPAVANWGLRPTFQDGHQPSFEVHLLTSAALDLLGREVRFGFVERLRGEIQFGSADALVAQIRVDMDSARQLLT